MKFVKKWKRYIVMFLIVNMMAFIPALIAGADGQSQNEQLYESDAGSGKCGDDLTWTVDENATLIISGTGNMYEYDDESDIPWYDMAIKSVKMENGVTSICKYAFCDLSKVTDISIGNTVKTIGTQAFYNMGNENLSVISLPDSVTTIQAGTFTKCRAKRIEIGSGLKTFDGFYSGGKFAYCSRLEEISVSKDNEYFTDIDGVLYSKDEKTILAYPAAKSGNTYSISKSVKYIGEGAFSGSQLSTIVIPDGVISIDSEAFFNCERLERLDIPASVRKVSGIISGGIAHKAPDAIYFYGDAPEGVLNGYTPHCSYTVYYPIGNSTWTKEAMERLEQAYSSNNPDVTWEGWNPPLATPEIISISNASKGVTIKWGTVDGAVKYRVFRKTSSEDWTTVADTVSSSYTDTTVKSGTTYTYTVRCIASDGSDYTSGEDSTGKTIKYLSVPSVSVTNESTGVTVKWGKVRGASGYYVYRKTGTKKYDQIGKAAGNSTCSFTDTTAKSGTTYTYTVRAYSGSTKSSYTGKTIKYLSRPSVSVSNVSSGIIVKWGKITGASGYYVYRKSGNSWEKIKTVKNSSTLNYTDTTVKSKDGTTYLYKVKAYSGSCTSSSVSGKKIVRLTTPSISSSSVSNSGSKKMTVKWSKNSKATGYQIKYVTGTVSKMITVKNASTVSRTITGLTKGKTYKVYVRAYKTVLGVNYYSGWSSAKSVKISK